MVLAQSGPQSRPPAVPDHVLYWFLFDHISTQDRLAAARAAAGQQADEIKNYYQKTIGLSAADFQPLHDISIGCQVVVAAQDAAAARVIKSFRAQLTAAKPGSPLPSPPPVLDTMQQQRNNSVLNCMDQLKQRLTPAGLLKVDTYVHQQLSRNVSTQKPAASVRATGTAPVKPRSHEPRNLGDK
jgi:hypothetical protein